MPAVGAVRLLRSDVPPPPPRGPGGTPPPWQPPAAPPGPPPPGPPPSGPPPGAGGQTGPSGTYGRPWAPRVDEPGHLLPMRPLGVGDVLDGTVTILRRGFKVLAAIVLLVHGPYQLLSALVIDRLLPELAAPIALDPFLEGAVPIEMLSRLLLVGGTTAIVALLVHVLVGAAVVAAIQDLDHGRPATAGSALRAGFSVSGSTLGASVLLLAAGIASAIVLTVGLTLLGVAIAPLAAILGIVALLPFLGIALSLTYLVLPIAVVEQTGPVRTLSRAVWVLRRRFWWVLGVTALALLLVAAVTFAVQIALALVALLAGPAAFAVQAVGATLGALVSVPLTIGAAALIHHDARIRGEGYDLRARAQRSAWG